MLKINVKLNHFYKYTALVHLHTNTKDHSDDAIFSLQQLQQVVQGDKNASMYVLQRKISLIWLCRMVDQELFS